MDRLDCPGEPLVVTSPQPRTPAVLLSGLCRRYGPRPILDGLDLQLAPGRCLALLGQNGAGKTTLLRTLAGLLRPDGGTAQIFGCDLPGDSSLRRRIGMVGHEGALYGDLSARENLLFFTKLYGHNDPDAVDHWLSAVGLTDAAERRTGDFSRGMMQRLALARALLHRPDLLLLDEPFTGLDRQGTRLAADLLKQQREAGTTIVWTTHDVAMAAELADDTVVLARGRIAWHGQHADTATIAQAYDSSTEPVSAGPI